MDRKCAFWNHDFGEDKWIQFSPWSFGETGHWAPRKSKCSESSVHPCPVIWEPEVSLNKVSGIATSMRTTEEHVENDA